MEANQIKDLMEAYASVYAQPEEEEVLDEDLQGNVKVALEKGAEFMKKNPVGRAVGAVLQPVGKGRGTVTKAEQESKVKGNVKEEADIFDVILEYLITEGYADTNQAALVIMANMSEEWKQSIVEDIRGVSYTPNPVGDAIRTGAGLLQRAMSNPSVQGAIKTGSELLKKKVAPGGYSTRSGDNKPYEGGPLWDSDQKPEDVKNTPTPTRPRPPVKKPNPPMRDEPLW